MIVDWASGWAVLGAGAPGVAWGVGAGIAVSPPPIAIVPEVVPARGWRVLIPPELLEPDRLWVEGEARLALPVVQGRISVAHVGSISGSAAAAPMVVGGRARVVPLGEDEWLLLDID